MRRREPWGRWAAKAAMVLAVIFGGGGYAIDRFTITYDPQESRCLPGYRLMVVDRHDRTPERGAVFAFRANGFEPLFPDGALLAKVVDGVPGDRVEVRADATLVNGTRVAGGPAMAPAFKRSHAAFLRTFRVPDGHFLPMGRTADSFDGRYYGVVEADRIVGRVYRLL